MTGQYSSAWGRWGSAALFTGVFLAADDSIRRRMAIGLLSTFAFVMFGIKTSHTTAADGRSLDVHYDVNPLGWVLIVVFVVNLVKFLQLIVARRRGPRDLPVHSGTIVLPATSVPSGSWDPSPTDPDPEGAIAHTQTHDDEHESAIVVANRLGDGRRVRNLYTTPEGIVCRDRRPVDPDTL